MNRITILLLLVTLPLIASAADKRPMTVEDMWAMHRVSDPQLSPDGKWIAYTVTVYDMEENAGNADIWMIPAGGGEPMQLTNGPRYDGHPRWKPDGTELAFLSSRGDGTQIYLLPMTGGEARPLSNVPTGVSDFVWSPDGGHIAFTTSVYPDVPTLEATAERDSEKEQSKVKAKIIDRLLFRHWNHWTDGKRSNLFVMPASADTCWNAAPGDYDTPPISLGSSQDVAFSPDGTEIAFVRNTDPMVAISTNNDIFIVKIQGGPATNITDENEANDNQPVYSPDGKYIAYRAMARPGFEADQYDLFLYDRSAGTKDNLTENFDRDVEQILWAPDSKSIYFNVENEGRLGVFRITLASGGEVTEIIHHHYNRDLNISPDGKTLYFSRQRVDLPTEIFSATAQGEDVKQLTFTNASLLAALQMNPAEDFWFKSYDGKKVHGLMVKPPSFDPAKKHPMIFLIHGGPQGMWGDQFHYRWNAEMFAAPGYVAVMINFRGSKGYGQEFCDAVSKDWGGGPYKDLMSGLDYVLEEYEFIDDDKIAAAGASYGGFMINWIAGHTDRFKCLVSHDGVFDQRSMYGSTEELWFPEWEFNGTPYEHPDLYEKHSPSCYVKHFTTPTLVIHGENDFRVPVTQGFQMFTALQRMGVPSKLLYFPDEDHFVTKPQNARLWWNTVHGWIAEWINK